MVRPKRQKLFWQRTENQVPPQPAVLFCDQVLLVVDKPAGLLSVPDGYDPDKPYLRSLLEPAYGPLWIVHRLDKDTSGVVVLARSAAAHRELNSQFSSNQVNKIYHAIVTGLPPWQEKTIQAPLRTNVGRRKRTVVDPQRGKPAATTFYLLTPLRGHALLAAHPATGRTHQVRAHLYSLGYPLLGDPLYGPGEPSEYLQRAALHAQLLAFQHPHTAETVSFTAPYPADFKLALDMLKAA